MSEFTVRALLHVVEAEGFGTCLHLSDAEGGEEPGEWLTARVEIGPLDDRCSVELELAALLRLRGLLERAVQDICLADPALTLQAIPEDGVRH